MFCVVKSNQMSLPNVRFAVQTTSVTPPSITGRYQCTTQADRDVGYREWFKTVPAIYHEISMNERMNYGGKRWVIFKPAECDIAMSSVAESLFCYVTINRKL